MIRPMRCIITMVGLAALCVHATLAATFYVSPSGSDAPGTTGADWANAFLTIGNAVAHTTSGGADIVWVSNGVYEVSAEIALVHDTRIIGLGGAGETFVRHDQSTGSRIFSLNHADAVLDGLTITNALTTANGEGGGVYIGANGGTVRNCHVVGNRSSAGTRHGLGIYAVSGTITNCLVAHNVTYHMDVGNGPGVYLVNGILVDSTIQGNRGRLGAGVFVLGAGARVRRCLIIGNRANHSGGGAYVNAAAGVVIENTTIANNMSRIWGGGVWHNVNNALTITNSIVYHNAAPIGANYFWRDSATHVRYSCVTPEVAGAGNTVRPPEFVDPGVPWVGSGRYDNHNAEHFNYKAVIGDYRLRPGSPCILADGAVDMGAIPFFADALEANFTADVVEGFDPLRVVLTAHAAGANVTGLNYTWNLGDGSPPVSGADSRVVTNDYASGVYSPSLSVDNAADESAARYRTDYLQAGPQTLYVSLSGSGVFPFDSPAAATNKIQVAVDAAVSGSTIWVDAGTYTHASPHLLIEKPIALRSLHGHADTILDGQNQRRVLYLEHPDAVVDGFTITRGHGQQYDAFIGGAGVYIWSGGTVQNCWVHDNNAFAAHVGGVWNHYGGVVRNCLITANRGAGSGGMRNVHGILIENCTVSRNISGYPTTSDSSGLDMRGAGAIYNTIFYANTNSNVNADGMPQIRGVGTYHHTLCAQADTAWAASGDNNITDQDPAFVDFDNGNYRLQRKSPGVNAGFDLGWILEPDAVDLDGNSRRVGSAVDLGPFELPSIGTLILWR